MKKIDKLENIKANVADVVNIDRLSDQVSVIKSQVSSIKSKVEDFISKDEALWMSVSFFLLGLVIGMLNSPKGNTTSGSNNQVTNVDDEDEESASGQL
ncbi:MAG: hypothetical protein IJ723_01480 [Ruminococcus sp.]|nr:hypothetical protein [Ruminococcus sp.]